MKDPIKRVQNTALKRRWRDCYNRLAGKSIHYNINRYNEVLHEIISQNLGHLSAKKLAQKMDGLKNRVFCGGELDEILTPVFALVNEASRRYLDLTPYTSQLVAALALHQGKLVEMATGEGKTLAAVFPAVLNALNGRGVHILTANDYLAQRDARWMGPIYQGLGLSVGYIQEGMSIRQRQEAYKMDVTYLTAREAGFDYLRDNTRTSTDQLVHRPFHFAIVDEADLILIDEARIPLVIAGEYEEQDIDLNALAGLVSTLQEGYHFIQDENWRNVALTDAGSDLIESRLHCGSLYDEKNIQLFSAVNVVLHAQCLLHRDTDYIVRNGRVELVDEITGRVADGRRWPNGIHQAVEAKEGVPQQREGRVLGSITLQHFLALYPKIAGMTATAAPAAEEFKTFYDLEVVVVPPHQASRRLDHGDRIFADLEAKNQALIEEICTVHASGRPILVGTASVQESEILADLLKSRGIRIQVLNAKDDRKEAEIIANAGMPGSVTISTNMAGRGTDIRLGGRDERLKKQVAESGGLYVIGTNRHESLRIDFQLRGRAGRQGDRGSSRFFISLEDYLMRRYGLKELLPSGWLPERQGGPLKEKILKREVNRVQRIIEDQNFQIRRTLWQYAKLVEAQRCLIQKHREAILREREPLVFLEKRWGDRYKYVLAAVGRTRLIEVEKLISLSVIDRHWSDYLHWISEVKDGIHLQRLGGLFPQEEFRKRIDREFWNLMDRIDEEIIRIFDRLPIKNGEFDLSESDLRRPTSTWTYLINDNPFGGFNLALLAHRFAGSAAALGVVSLLLSPLILAVVFLKKWLRRRKKK